MGGKDLFSQNLILESDLQDFANHLLVAGDRLGVPRLQLVTALNRLFPRLRDAGAGRGHPLPATVELDGLALRVRWGEAEHRDDLATLPERPDPVALNDLTEQLRQATRVVEPARLLARNREIEQRFEVTRRSLRNEIQAIQADLAARQEALQESERQADTDALTGLFNRRAFDRQFEQAYRRACRQPNETLSLLLLDIDHFKEYNDEHGHLHGDQCLRRMAEAMRAATRTDVDSAYRIGGDEFAILLWADKDTACRRAMAILEAMEGNVSIGIDSLSEWNDLSQPARALFESADNALYASKEAGRGCVTIAACQRLRGRVGCVEHCAATVEPRALLQ